ncbi:acyltransferase [Clostridia bacterium]|nr:acyltransferase [Clostridia bacterium]
MTRRVRWFSIVRTLGLILVVCYHFFRGALPGGFIGVDVFFVFSGYLITALALKEFGERGRFGAADFFIRRFQRIFPPLLIAVIFTLPLVLLLDPDFIVNMGKRLAASLGFVRNYWEIANSGSYEATIIPEPYVHTWSLSVEAHFYIVWGVLFCIAGRLVGKHHESALSLKIVTATFSVILGALSVFAMQAFFTPDADNSAAYYATASHGFPFMFGAFAACLFGLRSPNASDEASGGFRKFAAISGTVLSIAGLVFLAKTLEFSGDNAYRWGFIAASVLAVALILSTRAMHYAFANAKEPRVLTIVSDLSYNTYLYHWPVFIAFSYSAVKASPAVVAGSAIAVSLALSALSYYVIEPIFRGKPIKKAVINRIVYPAVFVLMIGALAADVYVLGSAPEFSRQQTEFAAEESLMNYHELERIVSNRYPDPTPTPTLEATPAPTPTITPSAAATLSSIESPTPTPTPAPDNGGGVTIIGDSVCLGAAESLRTNIENCTVDAKVSRQFTAGLKMVQSGVSDGTLGKYLVIALGTNGAYTKTIDKIIDALPEGHRLIFVTPFDGRGGVREATKTTEYLRSIDGKYPFVTLADWSAAIEGHVDYLGADKIHIAFRKEAIAMYTAVIRDALVLAQEKSAK